MSSHDDALLVALFRLLYLAVVSRRRNLHRCASADGRSDGRQPLLRALVTGIGRLDVPDVGFENVAAASYTHLGEVADGILRLDVSCPELVSEP